jgi:ATP/maltotriose-dependent transcriptional regulator MalT
MEESLSLFRELGDECGIAIGLHRLAVGAIFVENDHARGRQLLDECFEHSPSPKVVGDAVAKLAGLEYAEGNLERALELYEEAAIRCKEIGFTWMEAQTRIDIAEVADQLGRTELAWHQAREGVELCRQCDDRQLMLFALAIVARIAASGGEDERAGRLWGAIEAEELRGRVGQWERFRDEHASAVVRDSPEFERGRSEGRSLSLEDAVEYAIGEG